MFSGICSSDISRYSMQYSQVRVKVWFNRSIISDVCMYSSKNCQKSYENFENFEYIHLEIEIIFLNFKICFKSERY